MSINTVIKGHLLWDLMSDIMAVEANVTLIDEYDLLMQDLEPFWGMSAKDLHYRTAMVSKNDVWIRRLIVRNHTMKVDSEGHAVRQNELPEIMEWIKPFADFLPNMDLVFNGVDEPRVIVPHGNLESSPPQSCPERGGSNHTDDSTLSEIASPPYEFLNNDKQNIWELATISCPSSSPAANTRFSPRPQPRDLDFVRNVSYVKDTCQNPDASCDRASSWHPTPSVPRMSSSQSGRNPSSQPSKT
ncbi:MAG: hypothetical protein LQ341_001106 [Variospora aurantia]|nr:MAG: hypothetical protein LQ341_001106 [Variospora aurantia]